MKNELLKKYQEQVNIYTEETFSFYDVYEVSVGRRGSNYGSSAIGCCICLCILYAIGSNVA